jgi:hypothetical protein
MEQELLRRRMTELLRNGRLRRFAIHPRVYAGYGEGLPCEVCGETISVNQVRYDIEDRQGASFRVHLGCRRLWEDLLREAHAEAP